ncbi:MAG: ubiquinol-cytochrome c reductase iron-sulfur subunit [Bryobacteraceae bacterium]|nr:ubiquinol-cytochrome c reductase iron-sulfur subunit [Bryobacteraceae bacterium]
MDTGRRGFFQTAIYGLWALISAALAIPAGAYLLFPPNSKREGDWVEAGDIKDLKPGHPEEMVFRRNRVDGWKIVSEKTTAWVLKKSEAEVIAFAPQCTHLGCAYHWNDRTREFLCPCHTSTFSPEGEVLTGPAPRALDRYETKLQGSKLLLGKIRNA